MTSLYCLIDTAPHCRLDDALEVRKASLRSYLKPSHESDSDCFDTSRNTVHVIVYADTLPLATLRLVRHDEDLAKEMCLPFSFSIARELDLSGLPKQGLVPGEVSRLCILEDWRRPEVLSLLLAGLYFASLEKDVSLWLGMGNCETEDAVDAQILFDVVNLRGLVSNPWDVRARVSSNPPKVPRATFYQPDERARAAAGQLLLRLPRPLRLFHSKLEARCLLAPVHDPLFRSYAMPVYALVEQVPRDKVESFLALKSFIRHAT